MGLAFEGALSELQGFKLFQDINAHELKDLCADSMIGVHSHRDVVFEVNDPALHFGVVLSGAYKLSKLTVTGEDAVIYFTCPGDVVAALVMPQKNPSYPVRVSSMGPSRMLIIPRERYIHGWMGRVELVGRIQGLLSTRMSRFQNQRVMQREPLPNRLAAMLLQWASKADKSNELKIPLPLTRKEIADTLGSTVESIIRVMSEWSKAEIIHTEDGYIRILKPGKLVSLMDSEETK